MASDVTYDATLNPSVAETSLRAVYSTHKLISALTTIKWITSFVPRSNFKQAFKHKLSVEKLGQACWGFPESFSPPSQTVS